MAQSYIYGIEDEIFNAKNKRNELRNKKITVNDYLNYSCVYNSLNYTNIFQNYMNSSIAPPNPSMVADLSANSLTDCEIIHHKLDKFIPDYYDVILLLCRRSAIQREEIKSTYKFTYSQGLIEHIEKYSTSKIRLLSCTFLYTGPDLDAFYIHESLYSLFEFKNKYFKNYLTNHSVLREIICTRSHIQLDLIKVSYKNLFKKELLEEIEKKIEEPTKSLFLNLFNFRRNDSIVFDNATAVIDILYLGDEKSYKFNQSKIIEIYTERSYVQLRRTIELFEKERGYPLHQLYTGITKGLFKKTLKTIVKYVRDSYAYYSEYILSSIARENVDEILRIGVSRCEIDLSSIVRNFHNKSDSTLKYYFTDVLDMEDYNYVRIIKALYGLI